MFNFGGTVDQFDQIYGSYKDSHFFFTFHRNINNNKIGKEIVKKDQQRLQNPKTDRGFQNGQQGLLLGYWI